MAEEADETGSLKTRLEGAMAQCLHVLYGVDLPHRDPDWGSMEVCFSAILLNSIFWDRDVANTPCHCVLRLATY